MKKDPLRVAVNFERWNLESISAQEAQPSDKNASKGGDSPPGAKFASHFRLNIHIFYVKTDLTKQSYILPVSIKNR